METNDSFIIFIFRLNSKLEITFPNVLLHSVERQAWIVSYNMHIFGDFFTRWMKVIKKIILNKYVFIFLSI